MAQVVERRTEGRPQDMFQNCLMIVVLKMNVFENRRIEDSRASDQEPVAKFCGRAADLRKTAQIVDTSTDMKALWLCAPVNIVPQLTVQLIHADSQNFLKIL